MDDDDSEEDVPLMNQLPDWKMRQHRQETQEQGRVSSSGIFVWYVEVLTTAQQDGDIPRALQAQPVLAPPAAVRQHQTRRELDEQIAEIIRRRDATLPEVSLPIYCTLPSLARLLVRRHESGF